ncbi:MAG: hypothetical protein ABSG17_03860 [Spirochaetia bacterium]|jgi:hypothetical protein
MRRALFVASVVASALLLLSCQKSQSPQPPEAAIADAKSCFSLFADLPLWEASGTDLVQKGSIQVGEKLALLGQTKRVTQGGKERELLRVRRDTGAEGWVREDYVASNAILAVVTSNDAVIYSVPRNTAATTATIPPLTVLVIHSDSGGMPFIRVSAYDPVQKVLLRGVYLRNEGVSARPDDVQAAILLQLAASSKSPKQQQAFISSGIKDYPQSLFLPQLQDALDALTTPPQTAQPSPAPSAGQSQQPGAQQGPAVASQAPASPATSQAPAPQTQQPAQQGASSTQ